MNIIQELRDLGVEYSVLSDQEISVRMAHNPDYIAILSLFGVGVWCEVCETYTGTTFKTGVLSATLQALDFAALHAYLFDSSIEMDLAS